MIRSSQDESSGAEDNLAAPSLNTQLREELAQICALVQHHTGNDFSNYKEGTLLRRIRRRLQVLHVESVADYVAVLSSNGQEAEALVKDLLIGVTQFFRDPEAFEFLALQVLPSITQDKAIDAPLRIWVPGCASGEEAYTIAMLIREHLDQVGQEYLVQLFATDLDAEMLHEGRQGRYPLSIGEQVSAERLSRFFVREGDTYWAGKELREMCLFSQHSLIRDPPFSELDLISCRNVLIYLSADLQKKLTSLFHYALRPSGLLLLGSSEGVTQSPELFESLDKRIRIFRRKDTVVGPIVDFPLSVRGAAFARSAAPNLPQPGTKERVGAAFEERSALAREEEGTESSPLHDQPGVQQLESELLTTRAELRSAVEELESANEELTSANEELVSTNEELQSANGELESSKEELQSLNEELETVNAELREKIDELASANATAKEQAQLVHLSHDAIIVRRFDGTIESWNNGAQELYGFSRAEAIGRNSHRLLKTDFPVPLADIEAKLRHSGRWNGELRHRAKDGQLVIVLSSKQYARGDDDVERILEANRDITQRAQVERDLRLSEEKFAKAFLGNTSAMAITRLSDGGFVEVNERWQEVTGFTRAEAIGQPSSQLNIWKDLEERAQYVRDLQQHGMLKNKEFRFVRQTGAEWIGLVSSQVSEIQGGPVVISSIIDITERKRADADLRRYALVVQQSRDIILFMDRDSGRIIEANPAAATAYGYSRDELLGLTIHDLRAPDTQAVVAGQMDFADPEGVLFESLHRRKDGSIFPVEVSSRGAAAGRTRTLVSVVRDITERRRAENTEREQRQQAEQRAAELDAILDSLAEPLMVSDAQGKLVRANPAFRRMLGNADEWRDSSVAERIRQVRLETADGQPIDPASSPGARALAGETVHGVLQRLPRPDGTVLHLATSSAPIRTASGIVGAVVVFSDITERVRAEQELREVDQRKNEFLAVLSHELRNPLTPVRNSLYVLRNAVPGSAQAKRAEDVIDRQTTQLARLVDDLLDITRVSQNKIRLRVARLDFNDVVQRALEDHRLLFEERKITVSRCLSAEPLLIDGDDARLTQVVGNLLSNAAKFTPGGGSVTIRTVTQRARRRVQLWVIDTGSGLEPATLRRLFEPFMQAEMTLDRSEGGLGLGLALVKSLVEMHGGEVCAHSEGAGRGTEFVIELPVVSTAAVGDVALQAASPPRCRRVLIIEDNVDAADSLREALEFGGHIVEISHSGPEGLQKAHVFNPEVVLCDIGLPGMDGYELARAFQQDESLKRAYLIALTGYALPDDLERAARAGFKRHLAKPPSIEALEEVLACAP